VYKSNPRTISEMKQTNLLRISSITEEAFHGVASNTRARVKACTLQRRGYFQHLT